MMDFLQFFQQQTASDIPWSSIEEGLFLDLFENRANTGETDQWN